MSVLVNGQVQPLPEPQTLAALLRLVSPATPFAVARNEEFVRRSDYHKCRIYPGDRIEIVRPVAGG
jgi:sulfur carrier protein